ncbi:serine/threonine-protein kinase EDR1-like isoform X1 [Salvia splendens]|uniref:serine/threonine-protein kinase EDR1-like isoform X1 n=3 Tax=Salvia splendens TaxID=180675 RepID=UPI001C27983C|nr:serine/threonine-protein kinase EDR1-like isoform X1 [Salvia splendens]XP_041994280.1 serine/threonine-protein kinase EDR1-like isoform X1 [Salvia splendens]XP_041994281.1 serine/threonine-protein kinase EDR1-like isoform X1 [Salvia splendens]
MEETTDDTRLVEGSVHNAQWWPSGLIDKLRVISLASPDETSSSKSKCQLDCGSPALHLASQILWDTGKLAEPIPDGFYFVYPERRFKELFDTIPSIDELQALDADGLRPNVILVDARKDKKLSMLKQLAVTLVRGLNPNPAAITKKLAGLVCDFFKRPKLEPDHVRGALEAVSHALDSQGIHMLGHVKHGSCHSKAILFKVLADTVGLECMLMVGLDREGVIQRSDAYRHLSAIVVLNSIEYLVDLARSPGKLVPCSAKAVLLSHLSAGESDSAENDSYDSPIEPNSPVRAFSDQTEVEGLSHSEPNSFWRRSRKKTIAEQRTASSSPEHPFFRGHGRSLLGDCRHSFQEYENDNNASRSVGASPIEARRRRRRCISMVPEIGDDIVRAVREMNETLKRNRHPEEQVASSYSCSASEQEDYSDRGSVSRFNPDPHDGLYGQKPLTYNLPLKQLHSQKAISLPSSPQRFSKKGYLMSDTSEICSSPDMMSTFNKVLESSKFLNQPLLPFEEWNIDFSELTIGARVGIGFFGEVFRGTWNGLDVGIKVFLEQDPTAENIEDFCNEISILSRIRHPNVILFLGACTTPPRLSLVTEFMEMGSLYYLIHASGLKKKLSWQRRLKMLSDICRGLTSIHRMNVVHRDLKSANCLVNKHWVVKICDFGLSRKLITRPMKDSSSAGTPEWMAPELIRNEPFTEKCDIFSLGVIMWELCTLKRPWEGIPSVQVVYAVGHDRQTLEIPEGPLGKLISDCWAEPDERPSCQEILSRLQECELLLCY